MFFRSAPCISSVFAFETGHLMKIVAIFVLVLTVLTVDSVEAQLFRRNARLRRTARPPVCCCDAPAYYPQNSEPAASITPHAFPAKAENSSALLAPTLPHGHRQVVTTPSADDAKTVVGKAVPLASSSIASPSDKVTGDEIAVAIADTPKWKTLFDGKQLGDWKVTRFGGEGEVYVEDGQINCEFGQYITGVTYTGKNLPKNSYEIELEAMRVDGSDFFCGLTFPVDDSHATFVVGGWGGSVTGISSIDDYDASENDTTNYMPFENNKWYKIRVRVTKGVLEAWINEKKMVSKEIDGSRLSTRIEVDPSKPLGVACFDTKAAYRNIRIRPEKNADSPAKKQSE